MDINSIRPGMSQEDLAAAAREVRRALSPDPPQATEAEQLQATQATVAREAVSQLETQLSRRLNSTELDAIIYKAIPTSTEEQRAAVKAMVGTSMNDERWVASLLSDPFNRERAGTSIVGDIEAQKKLAGEIAAWSKREGRS